MIGNSFPDDLSEYYKKKKEDIKKRLEDFRNVPAGNYFYELCFCILTPQSKAINALKVENILRDRNFFDNPFDVTNILRNPDNYIRFHNQKAKRLMLAREQFPEIEKLLESDLSGYDKRLWLVRNVNGFGMKESSHFLRNIGYKNLAILDRHILNHLVIFKIFKEIPKVTSINQYLDVERKFIDFSVNTGIPMDELDLLFWSYETGEILK